MNNRKTEDIIVTSILCITVAMLIFFGLSFTMWTMANPNKPSGEVTTMEKSMYLINKIMGWEQD